MTEIEKDIKNAKENEQKKNEDKIKNFPFLYLYCLMISFFCWVYTVEFGIRFGLITRNKVAFLTIWGIWAFTIIIGGIATAGLYGISSKHTEAKKEEYIEQSLALCSGSVRGYLIICLLIVSAFYLIFQQALPLHFLIAFNIILLYYEIKPEEVLPKQFVVEIPENYATLDRMPKVSKFVDDVIKKLEMIRDETDDFLKNFKNELDNLSKKGEEALKDLIDKAKNLIDHTKKFSVKGKTFFEQIGLMVLLVSIGVFSGLYIETSADPSNIITISLAAFLAAISIGFGLNLSELMVNGLKGHFEESMKKLKEGTKEIQKFLEGIKKYEDKILRTIEELRKEFRKKNILTFLPQDIVACISINAMAYLSSVALLIPTMFLSEIVLIGMEFIIGYYFLTKK
ncbi:MAG: hypothetical protein ACFFDF_19560 [Candidatus Odinarchaeota archaeon]